MVEINVNFEGAWPFRSFLFATVSKSTQSEVGFSPCEKTLIYLTLIKWDKIEYISVYLETYTEAHAKVCCS